MLKKLLIFFISFIFLFFLFNNVIMPLYVKHSDTVKVPKVLGMNYIEAKKVFENAGLEIKQGDVKYDETAQIGVILDQNPPADEIVKNGRRIYVSISGGEQLTEVPILKGRSLRDAKFSLEQRGLKLGETVRKSSGELPEDFVLSQIIQPGSKIKRNSSIDLILSDGPSAGDLKVPEVTGKNLEEAKKIITENKLKVGKITYQTNNDLPPGQIIDQYPKFSKSANENTSVDLFVARKKVVVTQENEEETGADEKENTDKENDKAKPTETPNTNGKEKVKENPADITPEKKVEKKQTEPGTKKEENIKPKAEPNPTKDNNSQSPPK